MKIEICFCTYFRCNSCDIYGSKEISVTEVVQENEAYILCLAHFFPMSYGLEDN